MIQREISKYIEEYKEHIKKSRHIYKKMLNDKSTVCKDNDNNMKITKVLNVYSTQYCLMIMCSWVLPQTIICIT